MGCIIVFFPFLLSFLFVHCDAGLAPGASRTGTDHALGDRVTTGTFWATHNTRACEPALLGESAVTDTDATEPRSATVLRAGGDLLLGHGVYLSGTNQLARVEDASGPAGVDISGAGAGGYGPKGQAFRGANPLGSVDVANSSLSSDPSLSASANGTFTVRESPWVRVYRDSARCLASESPGQAAGAWACPLLRKGSNDTVRNASGTLWVTGSLRAELPVCASVVADTSGAVVSLRPGDGGVVFHGDLARVPGNNSVNGTSFEIAATGGASVTLGGGGGGGPSSPSSSSSSSSSSPSARIAASVGVDESASSPGGEGEVRIGPGAVHAGGLEAVNSRLDARPSTKSGTRTLADPDHDTTGTISVTGRLSVNGVAYPWPGSGSAPTEHSSFELRRANGVAGATSGVRSYENLDFTHQMDGAGDPLARCSLDAAAAAIRCDPGVYHIVVAAGHRIGTRGVVRVSIESGASLAKGVSFTATTSQGLSATIEVPAGRPRLRVAVYHRSAIAEGLGMDVGLFGLDELVARADLWRVGEHPDAQDPRAAEAGASLAATVTPYAWGIATHAEPAGVDRAAVEGAWNCVDLTAVESLGPAGRIVPSDDGAGCQTVTLGPGRWQVNAESISLDAGASQLRAIDVDSAANGNPPAVLATGVNCYSLNDVSNSCGMFDTFDLAKPTRVRVEHFVKGVATTLATNALGGSLAMNKEPENRAYVEFTELVGGAVPWALPGHVVRYDVHGEPDAVPNGFGVLGADVWHPVLYNRLVDHVAGTDTFSTAGAEDTSGMDPVAAAGIVSMDPVTGVVKLRPGRYRIEARSGFSVTSASQPCRIRIYNPATGEALRMGLSHAGYRGAVQVSVVVRHDFRGADNSFVVQLRKGSAANKPAELPMDGPFGGSYASLVVHRLGAIGETYSAELHRAPASTTASGGGGVVVEESPAYASVRDHRGAGSPGPRMDAGLHRETLDAGVPGLGWSSVHRDTSGLFASGNATLRVDGRIALVAGDYRVRALVPVALTGPSSATCVISATRQGARSAVYGEAHTLITSTSGAMCRVEGALNLVYDDVLELAVFHGTGAGLDMAAPITAVDATEIYSSLEIWRYGPPEGPSTRVGTDRDPIEGASTPVLPALIALDATVSHAASLGALYDPANPIFDTDRSACPAGSGVFCGEVGGAFGIYRETAAPVLAERVNVNSGAWTRRPFHEHAFQGHGSPRLSFAADAGQLPPIGGASGVRKRFVEGKAALGPGCWDIRAETLVFETGVAALRVVDVTGAATVLLESFGAVTVSGTPSGASRPVAVGRVHLASDVNLLEVQVYSATPTALYGNTALNTGEDYITTMTVESCSASWADYSSVSETLPSRSDTAAPINSAERVSPRLLNRATGTTLPGAAPFLTLNTGAGDGTFQLSRGVYRFRAEITGYRAERMRCVLRVLSETVDRGTRLSESAAAAVAAAEWPVSDGSVNAYLQRGRDIAWSTVVMPMTTPADVQEIVHLDTQFALASASSTVSLGCYYHLRSTGVPGIDAPTAYLAQEYFTRAHVYLLSTEARILTPGWALSATGGGSNATAAGLFDGAGDTDTPVVNRTMRTAYTELAHTETSGVDGTTASGADWEGVLGLAVTADDSSSAAFDAAKSAVSVPPGLYEIAVDQSVHQNNHASARVRALDSLGLSASALAVQLTTTTSVSSGLISMRTQPLFLSDDSGAGRVVWESIVQTPTTPRGSALSIAGRDELYEKMRMWRLKRFDASGAEIADGSATAPAPVLSYAIARAVYVSTSDGMACVDTTWTKVDLNELTHVVGTNIAIDSATNRLQLGQGTYRIVFAAQMYMGGYVRMRLRDLSATITPIPLVTATQLSESSDLGGAFSADFHLTVSSAGVTEFVLELWCDVASTVSHIGLRPSPLNGRVSFASLEVAEKPVRPGGVGVAIGDGSDGQQDRGNDVADLALFAVKGPEGTDLTTFPADRWSELALTDLLHLRDVHPRGAARPRGFPRVDGRNGDHDHGEVVTAAQSAADAAVRVGGSICPGGVHDDQIGSAHHCHDTHGIAGVRFATLDAASGSIHLAAGTYRVAVTVPATSSLTTAVQIRDSNTGEVYARSDVGMASNTQVITDTRHLLGRFTVTAAGGADVVIDAFSDTSTAKFGIKTPCAGRAKEVYVSGEIWRLRANYTSVHLAPPTAPRSVASPAASSTWNPNDECAGGVAMGPFCEDGDTFLFADDDRVVTLRRALAPGTGGSTTLAQSWMPTPMTSRRTHLGAASTTDEHLSTELTDNEALIDASGRLVLNVNGTYLVTARVRGYRAGTCAIRFFSIEDHGDLPATFNPTSDSSTGSSATSESTARALVHVHTPPMTISLESCSTAVAANGIGGPATAGHGLAAELLGEMSARRVVAGTDAAIRDAFGSDPSAGCVFRGVRETDAAGVTPASSGTWLARALTSGTNCDAATVGSLDTSTGRVHLVPGAHHLSATEQLMGAGAHSIRIVDVGTGRVLVEGKSVVTPTTTVYYAGRIEASGVVQVDDPSGVTVEVQVTVGSTTTESFGGPASVSGAHLAGRRWDVSLEVSPARPRVAAWAVLRETYVGTSSVTSDTASSARITRKLNSIDGRGHDDWGLVSGVEGPAVQRISLDPGGSGRFTLRYGVYRFRGIVPFKRGTWGSAALYDVDGDAYVAYSTYDRGTDRQTVYSNLLAGKIAVTTATRRFEVHSWTSSTPNTVGMGGSSLHASATPDTLTVLELWAVPVGAAESASAWDFGSHLHFAENATTGASVLPYAAANVGNLWYDRGPNTAVGHPTGSGCDSTLLNGALACCDLPDGGPTTAGSLSPMRAGAPGWYRATVSLASRNPGHKAVVVDATSPMRTLGAHTVSAFTDASTLDTPSVSSGVGFVPLQRGCATGLAVRQFKVGTQSPASDVAGATVADERGVDVELALVRPFDPSEEHHLAVRGVVSRLWMENNANGIPALWGVTNTWSTVPLNRESGGIGVAEWPTGGSGTPDTDVNGDPSSRAFALGARLDRASDDGSFHLRAGVHIVQVDAVVGCQRCHIRLVAVGSSDGGSPVSYPVTVATGNLVYPGATSNAIRIRLVANVTVAAWTGWSDGDGSDTGVTERFKVEVYSENSQVRYGVTTRPSAFMQVGVTVRVETRASPAMVPLRDDQVILLEATHSGGAVLATTGTTYTWVRDQVPLSIRYDETGLARASLTSVQGSIVLPAGTYEIDGSVHIEYCTHCAARLVDADNARVLVAGMFITSGSIYSNHMVLFGRFTLRHAATVRVDVFQDAYTAARVRTTTSGEPVVYASFALRKFRSAGALGSFNRTSVSFERREETENLNINVEADSGLGWRPLHFDETTALWGPGGEPITDVGASPVTIAPGGLSFVFKPGQYDVRLEVCTYTAVQMQARLFDQTRGQVLAVSRYGGNQFGFCLSLDDTFYLLRETTVTLEVSSSTGVILRTTNAGALGFPALGYRVFFDRFDTHVDGFPL